MTTKTAARPKSVYPNMVDILPESKHGTAEIKHFFVSKHLGMMSAMKSPILFCEEGTYAQLYVDGQLVMADTTMERRSNWEFITKARGDVLIAGLGLGMIVVAIADKPEVTSITVIEKSQDVIDLVLPHVNHPKLTVICADIFEWRPPFTYRQYTRKTSDARHKVGAVIKRKVVSQKFDVVYFDIWPDIGEDNLPDMYRLMRAFANYRKPGGWADCWMKRECERMRRNNNSEARRFSRF